MHFKKNITLITLVLILLCFFGFLFATYSHNNVISQKNEVLASPIASQHEGFSNITEYWKIEKERVESTPFNFWINETTNEEYEGIPYNRTELSYDVPNWVDASPTTFRINATLYTPTNNSGNLGLLPGIVFYHGLEANRSQNREYVQKALTLGNINAIFLCPDQPGHGDSGGAKYEPSNWYYTGDFNKTSHNYLAICAGLQAIRVIMSFENVNSSQIGVIGASYGGMTSMWVSSIYNNLINLTMPLISCGALQYTNPNSLLYKIMNATPGTLENFWQSRGKEIDPIYYLNLTTFPNICWFFGTHDDFFPFDGLNITYNTVPNSSLKSLQITPNGHHGRLKFEETSFYMINHTFFGGPSPPKIQLISSKNTHNIAFSSLSFQFLVECDTPIKRIEICYHYKDIFADPWRTFQIEELTPDSGIYEGNIKNSWLSSRIEFFLIVHLDKGENVWFTSQNFYGGILTNAIEIMIILAIISVLAVPVVLILKIRYEEDVKDQKIVKENMAIASRLYNNFKIEVVGVMIGESIIIYSLWLSWLNWDPLEWNFLFLIESFATYTPLLGNFAYYSVLLIGLSFYIGYLRALSNPLKGGAINSILPLLMIIVAPLLIRIFSIMYLKIGYGPYIFLGGALFQFIIGIWQKWYRRKYDVIQKRYFHYLRKKPNKLRRKRISL